nr:berberine bridge enzyme-like 15 [Ipomoea batatas]
MGTIINNGTPYYFKGKSDYVKTPIPVEGLEGVWDFLKENNSGLIIMSPYGGIMEEISESAIPFPHRAGNLYKIQYGMSWSEAGKEAYESHMSWIRRLFRYYTPFVSKSPREAYVNYRDLDIGRNSMGKSTYGPQSKNWGVKYFKNNFERLVSVKTQVDPQNFFRNEQSIPPRLKQCLIRNSQNQTASIFNDVYTPDNSSFVSVLQYPIKNTRFNSSDNPKPFSVIRPKEEAEVQSVILCAVELNLRLRTRSGGHDYEGLSYTTPEKGDQTPFLVLDLTNFNNVSVDSAEKTAWVGSGATVGDLYYRISEKSKTLGFPAGVCHSIGIGGHFSGGGYGMMLRKHGLAADHVVDARLVDAKGKILDRTSMGEDLFWAIRGGGGNTFGVVLSWKVELIDVPETVTTFHIVKTPEQNATNIVHKWQSIAPKLPQELFIRIIAIGQKPQNTVQAMFNSLYLGPADTLLPILQQSFPELGATRQDLGEMSWIEALTTIDGFPKGTDPKALTGTIVNQGKPFYFKGKSDYVKNPIPVEGLEGIWDFLRENNSGLIIMSPYGGRMEEIPESAIPFPHRAGNLYKIQYIMDWSEAGREAYESHMGWIRRLFHYNTPFVSKSPREAYVNYRDLDIGRNSVGNLTYGAESKNWGMKYFKNNFERLVTVKTQVDPQNFFRNEQSIPPRSHIVN